MQERKAGAKKLNEAFVTAKNDISDWYCTNRPLIETILDVPNLVQKFLPAPSFGGEPENGGGGWIRTIELIEGRFTVCCGWPLRYPTTRGFRRNAYLVERKGFEPSTPTLRT